MSGDLRASLALRVAYPPLEPSPHQLSRRTPEGREKELSRWPRSWSRRPATLAVDVRTDADQHLSLAGWELRRFARPMAGGLVLPDGVHDAGVLEWAAANPLPAGRLVRGGGARSVHGLTVWRNEILRPYVLGTSDAFSGAGTKAWLVMWDAPWVVSRVAANYAEGRGRNYGAWSFGMFDRPDSTEPGDGFPRAIVRQLGEETSFQRWGNVPKGAPSAGPIIDLRCLVRGLLGNGVGTLEAACREFGVEPPRSLGGPGALADRVRAISELAEACFRECDWRERRQGVDRASLRPTGILSDPRRLYSSGSAASQMLRTINVEPLAERVIEGEVGHDRAVGAFASAFFGGRAEVDIARRPGDRVQHWDFSACYGNCARLVGGSSVMLADRLVVGDCTGEVEEELGRLARARDPMALLLDPSWWRRWGLVVVKVEAVRSLLPLRVPDGKRAGEFSVRRAPLTTAPDSSAWYMVTDLAAAVLAGSQGQLRVVEALRLRPEGKASGLYPVVLPGEVAFDPYSEGADLFVSLLESRRACAQAPGWSARERSRREQGVKGLLVSTASGVVGRVDYDQVPERPERRSGAVVPTREVIGPEGERISVDTADGVERPGPDFFPPLASAVTAGSRLLLALVERMVSDKEGRVHQVLTDALTVSADVDMKTVARRLHDGLGVTLRPQYGTAERPASAYVMGRNRYALLQRGRLEHVSEFGLGGVYCDPTGAGGAGASGARRWVEDAFEAVMAADGGRNDLESLELPYWSECWAVSPFQAATEAQRRWLGADARPFDQGLSAHLAPVLAGEAGAGAPVARALHTTLPERWPTLAWCFREGRPATALDPDRDGGLIVPDGFFPKTFRGVIGTWAISGEPGKGPVWAWQIGPHRGPLDAVPVVALAEPVLIGKEGRSLLERARGVAEGEGVIAYSLSDAELVVIRRILTAMDPHERAQVGLVGRTGRRAAAGTVPRNIAEVIRSIAMKSAFEQFNNGKGVTQDTLTRLVEWAESLESCRTPGCTNTRDKGRSVFCAGCRREGTRVRVAAHRARGRARASA